MRPVSPTEIGREIVVQQEGLLVRARQRVDPLLVLAGAERGDHQRLGLAAGEQRRAVRARQDAGFRHDRAHGLEVAAVDALAGVEDVPADDLGLELLEHAGDAQLVVGRLLRAFGEVVRRRPWPWRHRPPCGAPSCRRPRRRRAGPARRGRASPSRAPRCRSSVSSRGSLAAFSASSMIALITGWKWR